MPPLPTQRSSATGAIYLSKRCPFCSNAFLFNCVVRTYVSNHWVFFSCQTGRVSSAAAGAAVGVSVPEGGGVAPPEAVVCALLAAGGVQLVDAVAGDVAIGLCE